MVAFFCTGNALLSLRFLYQRRYLAAISVAGLALFLYLAGLRKGGKLEITQAGLDYVHSPAYALEMSGMVAQFWKPEGSFYEMLMYVTAIRLSGREPDYKMEKEFRQFVIENLLIIRAEIDRIKVWQPAIEIPEDNWEKEFRR